MSQQPRAVATRRARCGPAAHTLQRRLARRPSTHARRQGAVWDLPGLAGKAATDACQPSQSRPLLSSTAQAQAHTHTSTPPPPTAGFWRNYLKPQGLAAIATDGVLDQIKRQREAEERARLEERAKAQVGGWAARVFVCLCVVVLVVWVVCMCMWVGGWTGGWVGLGGHKQACFKGGGRPAWHCVG